MTDGEKAQRYAALYLREVARRGRAEAAANRLLWQRVDGLEMAVRAHGETIRRLARQTRGEA